MKEKLRLMKYPEAMELRALLSPMQEQNSTQYQRAVATTKRLYSNEEIHHKVVNGNSQNRRSEKE